MLKITASQLLIIRLKSFTMTGCWGKLGSLSSCRTGAVKQMKSQYWYFGHRQQVYKSGKDIIEGTAPGSRALGIPKVTCMETVTSWTEPSMVRGGYKTGGRGVEEDCPNVAFESRTADDGHFLYNKEGLTVS